MITIFVVLGYLVGAIVTWAALASIPKLRVLFTADSTANNRELAALIAFTWPIVPVIVTIEALRRVWSLLARIVAPLTNRIWRDK